MKKVLVYVVGIILLLAIVFGVSFLQSNVFDKPIIYKYKNEEVTDDALNIAKYIHILDSKLDYVESTLENNNKRLVVSYKLKDGVNLNDLTYDEVDINSQLYFALLKNLEELRLAVNYVDGANVESTATYTKYRNATAKISYNDKKADFVSKYEKICEQFDAEEE